MAKPVDEKTLRRRACHGWAFREWTPEEADAIKAFLHEETDEVPEFYAAAYRVVVENADRPRNRQRKQVIDTPDRLVPFGDPRYLDYSRKQALSDLFVYLQTPRNLKRAAWTQILRRLYSVAAAQTREQCAKELEADAALGESAFPGVSAALRSAAEMLRKGPEPEREHCDVRSLTGTCPHPAGTHEIRAER